MYIPELPALLKPSSCCSYCCYYSDPQAPALSRSVGSHQARGFTSRPPKSPAGTDHPHLLRKGRGGTLLVTPSELT